MVHSSRHPFEESRPIKSNPHVFKPQGSTLTGIVGLVILIGLIASEIFLSLEAPSLTFIGVCSLLATALYLFFIHSRVVFYDEGLEVINPLTTHRIDWSSIEEIGAKYSMFVRTQKRTVRASAAPVSGRLQSRRNAREDLRGFANRDAFELKGSESPSSHSGIAIHIARTRMKESLNSQRGNATIDELTYNIGALATLLGLALVTLLSLIFR